MSQIGGLKPIVLELQPGTYWWCACGRSKIQPFCDGSHEGTGIEPREVIIAAPTKCSLCTCKLTRNPPFCDGSHKSIPPQPSSPPPSPSVTAEPQNPIP